MKKLVKQQSKYWISLLLYLMLISCTHNTICYDLEKQVLRSKTSGVLRTLTINDTKESSAMIWILKKKESKGSKEFSFQNIDTLNYIYENSDFIPKRISYKGLLPNSIYEIRNKSNGDASPYKLIIETNNLGEITYTDCNCD